jgi:hypothetical protein
VTHSVTVSFTNTVSPEEFVRCTRLVFVTAFFLAINFPFHRLNVACPRQDSNLRLRLKRTELNHLSYGGISALRTERHVCVRRIAER